jgi:hypothetical protein
MGGAETQRRTAMTYQYNPRSAAKRPQPPMNAAEIDALLLDDEADDFLDRHVAAIRESLADFRNA